MANIKSQIKRNKTSEKARIRNHAVKSEVRTAIKKVKVAVEAKELEKAIAAMDHAYALIDKSVSKGVQHANTAARQKATVAKLVDSIR